MRDMTLLGASFGDILSRPKFPFKHFGVYLGDGRVLHNSPEKGEHVSDVREFSSGHEIEVTPTPPDKKAEIMQRVQDTVRKPRSFDAPTNNCEHTKTRITEGRAYSSQVVVVSLLALAFVVIVFSRGR